MKLPLLIQKLTAPKQVKRVLAVLDHERALVANQMATSMGFDLATPHVANDVLRWSKEIAKDSRTPRIIGLWLVTNVTRDYLGSGRFHIYRGSLSMQGQALKAANTYCMAELVKLGQMTAEEQQAARVATNEEIKEVG